MFSVCPAQTRRKETTRNDPSGFSSVAAAIAGLILTPPTEALRFVVVGYGGDGLGSRGRFARLRPFLFDYGGEFGHDQMEEFERAPEDQEHREDDAHSDQEHLSPVTELIRRAFQRLGYVDCKHR